MFTAAAYRKPGTGDWLLLADCCSKAAGSIVTLPNHSGNGTRQTEGGKADLRHGAVCFTDPPP